MNIGKFSLTLLAVSTCATCQLPAQQTSNSAIIKVSSRLVYVDVVARDSGGRIVNGLTQSDFKIQEDGKPQKIDFFAAHSFMPASKVSGSRQAQINKVKPNNGATYFTNIEDPQSDSGINIILFDLLNTPAIDQARAREQLIRFLRLLPPGNQIALFILSDQLQMVQSFTRDSTLLARAAERMTATDLGKVKSSDDRMHDADTVASGAKALAGGGSTIEAIHMMEILQRNTAHEAATSIDTRARITMSALANLVRATSGYSGRKKLLWLSESFPVAIGAQLSDQRFENVASIPGAREMTNALADARIAVYPINLGGVAPSGLGAEVSGTAETSLVGGASSILNPQMGNTLKYQFTQGALLREQMQDLAQQTGGEAFMGTNNLSSALQRSIVDDSNYYTLAYRPTDQNWNGQVRKIRVEGVRKGLSLTYRRSYIAAPDSYRTGGVAQQLNYALQPGTPQSTQISLRSSVEMLGGQHPNLLVRSKLDLNGISLALGSDGHRRGQLLVMIVAFDSAGDATSGRSENSSTVPPHSSGVLNLDLSPSEYAALTRTGMTIGLKLTLSAGSYRVRVGVADVASGRIGTIDIPVVLP